METLGVLSAAFVLGLSSSIHCGVMCGPVQSAWLKSTSITRVGTYHLGRLLSYIGIAFAFFQIGQMTQISWSTTQGTLMLGVSLIIGVLMYLAVEYLLPNSWTRPLLRVSSQAGALPLYPRLFVFGLINGLLPCGMVWMAASLSTQLSSAAALPLLMGSFMMGTLPILLGVGVLRNLIGRITRQNRWTPFLPIKLRIPLLVLFLGLWFAVRGYYFGEQLPAPGQLHEAEAICLPILPH